MTSWSGCECSNDSLDYTDDQINQFNSEMNSHSYTKLSTYHNLDVWSSDVAEDYSFNGADYLASDDATAWAYSGHGVDITIGGARACQEFCVRREVGDMKGTAPWKPISRTIVRNRIRKK
jgi:hypothetical protein